MFLIKGAEIYSPEKLNKQDVLIGGGSILAIKPKIDVGNLPVEVIDGAGLKMTPGLIDLHAHIAGAGGEGGPSTRTKEIEALDLFSAGVTTVIGCLGTDGITRNLESVLMKTKALNEQGLSAKMYTGSYQVPCPTLTKSVARDLALIEEIIGVGEVAIADHRSSHPSTEELIKLVKETRVGGMLGAKAGIVHFHMGDTPNPFRQLYEIVEQSEMKFTQFLPTHCNRNFAIFEESKAYGKNGYIDLTTSSYPYFPDEEIKASTAVSELLKAGVPLAHITMSSDACGSLPVFDQQGNFVRLDVGKPMSLFTELRDCIVQEGIPLEQALQLITANPARILKLSRKGILKVGNDADLLLLDSDLKLRYVFSRGKIMMKANL